MSLSVPLRPHLVWVAPELWSHVEANQQDPPPHRRRGAVAGGRREAREVTRS